MTFEEFFKKKRIDLVALQQGEPALYSEFKEHFGQMGEKSFDHTKKYWFNKLRRRFVLAPEIKTEKPHVANPLAEQTITESLIETAGTTPPPKIGFVPKYRAGNLPKAAEVIEPKKEEAPDLPAVDKPVDEQAEKDEAKPAYQPRFKMKPKTEVGDTVPAPASAEPTPPVEETPQPKQAYQPRFKMKSKEDNEEIIPPSLDAAPIPPAEETPQPKPAYQPRFKVKPKDENG